MFSVEAVIFVLGLLVTGIAAYAAYSIGKIDVPYDPQPGQERDGGRD